MWETQEIWIQSFRREDPLEEGMATHSSILAWRIPWTEESGGLQSIGSKWLFFTSLCLCNFYYILIYSLVVQLLSRVWLCDPIDCGTLGGSVHGDFQTRNTGVGCLLPQGIFLDQGSKVCLCLLNWQVDSLPLYTTREAQSIILEYYLIELSWRQSEIITHQILNN